MKKRYLKTVEDVLALKNTDTKIYSECEGGYYQFVDGVLCAFDNNDDDWTIYPTLNDQEELYILEEEPAKEATSEDIGKLCWFFNAYDANDKIVGLLKGIEINGDRFYADNIAYYRHCCPLTKEEIKEFMEKAE